MIACSVGGNGLLLTPFLPHLIKGSPDIDHLYTIFLLYLVNSVASCFFTYKTAVLQADQKLHVMKLWGCGVDALRNTAQIAILFLTKNYLLFLAIKIPFTLMSNLIISHRAEKIYPFLMSDSHPTLTGDEKKSLLRNVFAMFGHRSGATILNSSDNLVISRFIGLTAVAINDNYVAILNMVCFACLYSV